jgi:hypothetical protein
MASSSGAWPSHLTGLGQEMSQGSSVSYASTPSVEPALTAVSSSVSVEESAKK